MRGNAVRVCALGLCFGVSPCSLLPAVPAFAEDAAHPSMLSAAMFFLYADQPDRKLPAAEDGEISTRGIFFSLDPNDSCVVLVEPVCPNCEITYPPGNGISSRYWRVDFKSIPDSSQADFTTYSDAILIKLPADAFCAAEQDSSGAFKPKLGQTCIASIMLLTSEFAYSAELAQRRLKALAYIQREFCPSDLPIEPKSVRPY